MNHFFRLKAKAEKLCIAKERYYYTEKDLLLFSERAINSHENIDYTYFVMFYYYDNSNYLGIHFNGLLIKEENKQSRFIVYSSIESVAVNEFSKESFIANKGDKKLVVKLHEENLYVKINNKDDIFGIERIIYYAIRFHEIRMTRT